MIIKDRVLWLDYAKFIGIFLVVWSHIPSYDKTFVVWMFSFHMPLFFILSGFVDKEDASVMQIAKKGIRSLLIPYVCFYLLSYIFWLGGFLLRLHTQDSKVNFWNALIKPILGMFVGEGTNTEFSTIVNVPLWFLVGLFFCKLFFRVGLNLFRKNYLSLLLLNLLSIAFVYFWGNDKAPYRIFWSLDSAMMCIPFYTFGFLARRLIDKLQYKFLRLLIGLGLLALAFILSKVGGYVDVNNFRFGYSLSLFYINGIIGSIGAVLIAQSFSHVYNRYLLYIGSNTLIILCSHYLIMIGLLALNQAFGIIPRVGEDEYEPFNSLILGCTVLLLSLVPVFIFRNYLLFFIGSKKTIL